MNGHIRAGVHNYVKSVLVFLLSWVNLILQLCASLLAGWGLRADLVEDSLSPSAHIQQLCKLCLIQQRTVQSSVVNLQGEWIPQKKKMFSF